MAAVAKNYQQQNFIYDCTKQIAHIENNKNVFNIFKSDDRLRSFEKCTILPKLQIDYDEEDNLKEDLVTVGFYFDESRNRIICFCCGYVLELKPGEKPVSKHWIEHPTCNNLNSFRYLGPKELDFLDTKKRIQSFALWPTVMAQRPREMAEAGFFYSGQGDKVVCFYCSGKFSQWQEGDDPWEEHAYWVPACQFVIISKGLEYARKVYLKGRHNNNRRRLSSKTVKNTQEESKEVVKDDQERCTTCFERNRNVCFLPCRHYASCASCSFAYTNCPVCRTDIESRLLVNE